MAGVQIADAKAPFIMFERRAVEDRQSSIDAGHYVAKDVDFVLITPHGSKDQFERVVGDWLANMEAQAQQGRLEPTWLRAYKSAYQDWKEGRETPLEGTPINNWPVISPAQIEMMRGLKVLTVEVLANANEELIRRMGMGGRVLVDKAKDYLATAKDSGKVVEQIGAMRQQVESLTKTVEALTQTNQQLSAQLALQGGAKSAGPDYMAQSPTPASLSNAGGNGISSNDLLGGDDTQTRRKL